MFFNISVILENLSIQKISLFFSTAFILFTLIETTFFVLDKCKISLPVWFNKKRIIFCGIFAVSFLIFLIFSKSLVNALFNGFLLATATTQMNDILKMLLAFVKFLYSKIVK